MVGVIGNIDERGGIGHDPPPVRKIRQVAERFHRLQRENGAGFTLGNQVGMDRRGTQPQVRLHVAPALAHAVHFGLLDMQSLTQGGFPDDGGAGEDALSPDAGKDNIQFHVMLSIS